MANTYKRSEELRERAHRVIPGGAHTYSKGDDQFPAQAPGFIERGLAARVWDVDGNEFVDWGMGLRSVILGHAFPPVLEAVRSHLGSGSNFTRPHRVEAELAEILVDLIPSAEMVKFAKNGSDATTAAVKLARAYTGRDIIARCEEQPFFSIDDWFIGDTPCNAGVPGSVQALTKRFSYNRPDTLQRLFDAFPNQVACVILEPASTEEPTGEFLATVKALCHRHGAVLIFDEMITGFRWHPRGAQTLFGVTPDLSTFGKAIGNGFSVSALVGRRDLMERGGLRHEHERVFLLSTTHGGETHALAAAKATVENVVSLNAVDRVWMVGGRLKRGIADIARTVGLESHVMACGFDCSPYMTFVKSDGTVWHELRALFLQETIRHGVLMPYIAPSFAHTDEDVKCTLDACAQALAVVKTAISRESTAGLLVGPGTKPVFRRFN